MSFRFKKAVSVVVGTFNIYIVQPNWLAQVGILDESAICEMQADLERPGFRFRIKESPFTWHVRPDRITLETETQNVDCGTPLSQVLAALNWTPLMGVGSNMDFEAPFEEVRRLRYQCPDFAPPDGFQLKQTTWHIALARGRQIFNFQMSAQPGVGDPKKVALSMNVHTEIKRDLKQREANAIGTEACQQFISHCRDAVRLATDVLGVEFSE